MKFALECAKNFLRKDDLLIQILKSDGFTLEITREGYCPQGRPIIEIKSIEDLLALAEKYESKLIFDPFPCKYADDRLPTITIYNYYLE